MLPDDRRGGLPATGGVPDIKALERFILQHLSKIPCVSSIRSSFALKQVRYKTALPLPEKGVTLQAD